MERRTSDVVEAKWLPVFMSCACEYPSSLKSTPAVLSSSVESVNYVRGE